MFSEKNFVFLEILVGYVSSGGEGGGWGYEDRVLLERRNERKQFIL